MALSVDPAQGVLENVELAGLIGDDHGVGQQAAGDDRTDHGGLGDLPATAGTQAEAVQMGLPRRRVGKTPALVAEQAGDHSFGNLVLDQVGRGGGVGDVVGMAGAQQVEEVQPASVMGLSVSSPFLPYRVAEFRLLSVVDTIAATLCDQRERVSRSLYTWSGPWSGHSG
jgi:hypothetical protein